MCGNVASEEEILIRTARKILEKCKKTPESTVIFNTKPEVDMQKIIELVRPMGVIAEICCRSTQTIAAYLDDKTIEKLKEEQ